MRGNVPVRFGGGRLETYSIRNAPTVYPIEEATGSSPVAPIVIRWEVLSLRVLPTLLYQDSPLSLVFSFAEM